MKNPLEIAQSRKLIGKPGGRRSVILGDWYWRLRSPNSKRVGIGGEGYKSRRNALNGFRAAMKLGNIALKALGK